MQIVWRRQPDNEEESSFKDTKLFPLQVLKIEDSTAGLVISCINTGLEGEKLFRDSELVKTATEEDCHIELILLYVNPVSNDVINDTYVVSPKDLCNYQSSFSYAVGQLPIINLTF